MIQVFLLFSTFSFPVDKCSMLIRACLDDWTENPMGFIGWTCTTNKITGLQAELSRCFFFSHGIWANPLQRYSWVFMNIGLARSNFASCTGPIHESYRILGPIILDEWAKNPIGFMD